VAAPSGVVTFLFTNVEGSTQLSSVSSSQNPLSCGTTGQASGTVRPVPNHRDQGRFVGDHRGGDDHAHVVLRISLLAGIDYRAHTGVVLGAALSWSARS
jgi:hypothetical protein